ncbi:MHC class I polypeptide-related sequence B-like isoform X3 [Marmota flaviventris]|uniref:MHC class I polypeptide-related sequence B-like isoform X3 n=1 Tax=Marmota flaviventris TaxID=93162 RepID=UPI003A83EAFC
MADPMRLGALLLLVGTALCAPLGSAVGTHSLHYNLTVRSQGGSVQSRSCAKGYWDHQLFLHFDSDKKESVKPQGPWAEKPLGTENWDTEIQELAEHRKNLKATLADINAWQEQKGVSPVVNVTCAEALEDTINVTCWAFGFYPQNISVTWLQDGEPLSQGTQQSGGIFSYENGTYQTWVSTRIPQGQEQGFRCHVGHSGNNSTGLVSCGEPGGPSRVSQPGTALLLPSQWAAFLGVAAAVGVLIMIIVCVCSCKKRKTKSTTEGSDPSTGVHPVRDLDCDHNNAKEQKMGLQFTLQNLRKTLVFFGKKTSEDCEDCGLQKSLLGMEEGSPGKPQENETLGEELDSQP